MKIFTNNESIFFSIRNFIAKVFLKCKVSEVSLSKISNLNVSRISPESTPESY